MRCSIYDAYLDVQIQLLSLRPKQMMLNGIFQNVHIYLIVFGTMKYLLPAQLEISQTEFAHVDAAHPFALIAI